ncbi:NPP1 family protein [Aspergillus candidus]|uniref:Putative NPP1 domain protein n=1 Tax=Aspergillus candidus TaxID=41067 RepID=A0A2I2EZD3_ASPCN|nr:putative NPP1 domain protein [Aspergillus candidus]PLB33734.1 putative NPP1 domain protein [Aspergillus candidus]
MIVIPLLAALGLAQAASIDHDKVRPLPQTIPEGAQGELYLAYQPRLNVVNGCVPYPAVDAEGNTGAGLKPTGPTNSSCTTSEGQIYVRSRTDEDSTRTALMYSWYFPKDAASPGSGHRHDWEGTIVWVSSPTSTSPENIEAVCPSAHGKWNCATKDDFSLDGSNPLIEYVSRWPLNHQMDLTEEVGMLQPLVAWESLEEGIRKPLAETDFGSAHLPLRDGNFAEDLDSATY